MQDADAAGFGAVWVRDHLLFHEPVYDPVALLGTIAGWTQRLEVGTGVYLPVLRNPVAFAKAFASLSLLSGRHVNVGVGTGGEYPLEWHVSGMPVNSRGRCLDEAIRLAAVLWAGRPASHDGSCFPAFENVALDLLPCEHGISVWIGGKSDAALRRTARTGDGWLAYFRSRRALAEQFERLDVLLAEQGRPRDAVERALIVYTVVTDDREADLEVAREFSARDLNLPGRDDLIDRYGILGPPEAIARELQAFEDLGVQRFIVLFPIEPARQRAQLERFATQVMPLLAPEKAPCSVNEHEGE